MNHLQVEADLKNIGFIEEFISTSKGIPDNKRTKALIIATELFDNIAEHAVFAEHKKLRLSVSNIFFPRLRIAVQILIICCVQFEKRNRILIQIQNDIAASA